MTAISVYDDPISAMSSALYDQQFVVDIGREYFNMWISDRVVILVGGRI